MFIFSYHCVVPLLLHRYEFLHFVQNCPLTYLVRAIIGTVKNVLFHCIRSVKTRFKSLSEMQFIMIFMHVLNERLC